MCLHLSTSGYARLGSGVVFQQRKGLRPGELLSILPEDIVLPEEQSLTIMNATVFLGLRTGTKAKRAQAIVLDANSVKDIIDFLPRL